VKQQELIIHSGSSNGDRMFSTEQIKQTFNNFAHFILVAPQ
jgi:hypothetical protein